MKITIPYKTRKDGVNLFLTLDALTNEQGEVIYEIIKDENDVEIGKRPIPRGFYIMQNETQILYTEAIDVENAPYSYSETDIPIEEEPSPEEELIDNELQ